jgi:hypothetical protein
MDALATMLGNRIFLFVFAAVCLLGLILLVLNIHLLVVGKRFRRLTRGADAGNLEQLLQDALRSANDVRLRVEQLEELERQLQVATANTLQRVGFIRFNAFTEGGNELSFVLALLNDHADGVVLCCLMNRDDCRIYAKSVTGGKSTYTLSEEERQAIEQAMGRS